MRKFGARERHDVDRPRIIFVNRVYWPSQAATAQLLTDLAEELARRNYPVHVIAAGQDASERHGVTVHRTGQTEMHHGLASRALNYLGFLRAARTKLAQLVRPGDVVIIMTDPPMLGALATGVVAKKGGRVIHWAQDIYPEIASAHAGRFFAAILWPLKKYRDRSWKRAEHCVTLGDDMAWTLAQAGVPAERIAQIPNWAPRELHTVADPLSIRQRRTAWGLADQFIVAYSGNLGRVHEFKAIVEAAEILKAHTEIVFLFIGRGARFEEVRHAATSRGLTNIRFLPPEPRELLPIALAAADAHFVTLRPDFSEYVYPSKLAGIMAVGRPVLFVGPANGDIARLIAAEKCGRAVQPQDATKLAGAIQSMPRDPAALAQMGQAARKAYEKHFTFQAAVADWERLFAHR